MPFSDTTNKNGIIQTIEFWTGLGDTGISSNSTLLKVITARVNQGFDRLMPLLLSYCDHLRWEDTNHTDKPIATFNLVSGQPDYKFTTDDNTLNVLNITDVRIYQSVTATDYVTLGRMTMDDERAVTAMSPNTNDTGTPTHFLEHGNVLYLYPKPNYAATNGIKVFFERDPSYFASSDTTKSPGIPRPFHYLLALYAAHDWLVVNKPANTVVITRIEAEIAKGTKQLSDLISARTPTRVKMTTRGINFR